MTRDDIIRMAQAIASQATKGKAWNYEYAMSVAMQLVDAGAAAEREACAQQIAILVEAEREACAQVAERMLRHYTQAVTGVPEAIRARGEK